MSTTLLAVILLGLAAGFGVLLVLAGIRGSDGPTALRRTPRLVTLARALAGPMLGLRVAAGLVAGVGVELATRWPVAAVAIAALIIGWPAIFGAAGATRNRIAQLEALALWTESLKDLVAGATGLHEAIPASVDTASPILQRPLGRLTGLLEAREPLPVALEQLAADLADPTADLVIAALIMNAKARGPGLASSLERLAESTREELELRRRIDASRRGGRRDLRIIITMVVVMAALMAFVFPPAFSQPYRTPVGQAVLLVVFGIFAACFAWIRRLSDPDVPETFLTRPGGDAVIAAIMAGGAVGLSLCFLAWALIPSRADNVAVLGRIEAARTARPWVSVQEPSLPTDRLGKLKALAGARVTAALSRREVEATTLRQDLAMVDREFEDFAGGSLVGLVVTFFGTLLAGALMVAAGVHWIPPVSLFPAALGLALVIVFARQHDVHKLAEERRREFRRGLSAYLDLVAMSVLGGTGLPEALPTAAAIGKGWPFRLLSETLDRARDMSGPLAAPTELGNLGRRLGVSELRDLATALSLTGEQGARIGKTLIGRAKTLRDRDTADVQGRAAERDSSLQVAQVGIGAGFLLFVVYPLVVSVLHL